MLGSFFFVFAQFLLGTQAVYYLNFAKGWLESAH